MKFLAFSDLHVHKWKDFSSVTRDGLSSRVVDALNCVDEVIQYAVKHDINTVVFLGDIFETKGVVSMDVFNPTYNKFAEFGSKGIDLIMVVGNHDLATRTPSIHAMEAFKSIATVIDRPRTVKHRDGGVFLGAPFSYSASALSADLEKLVELRSCELAGIPCVQLLHCDCNAGKTELGFTLYNDIAPSRLHFDSYDLTLMGHYHMFQCVHAKGFYVGAPYERHSGDVNRDVPKGFLLIDVEADKPATIQHVESSAPKIETITLNEEGKVDFGKSTCTGDNTAGKYVKLVVPAGVNPARKLTQSAIAASGALGVEMIESKVIDQSARMVLSHDAPMADVIRKFILDSPEEVQQLFADLDKERLMNIGIELLEEAV